MREFVETSSDGKWRYSGGTDLVLINAVIPAKGPITVDWESVQSGQVTDRTDGTSTLTLAQVVERITRDIRSDLEDKSYGVGEVTDPCQARGLNRQEGDDQRYGRHARRCRQGHCRAIAPRRIPPVAEPSRLRGRPALRGTNQRADGRRLLPSMAPRGRPRVALTAGGTTSE